MARYAKSYPDEVWLYGKTEAPYYPSYRKLLRQRTGYVTKPLGSSMCPHVSKKFESFVIYKGIVNGKVSVEPVDAPNSAAAYFVQNSLWTAYEAKLASNIAYERLVSKIGSRAEMLLSLAERKQAASMITQRALQLARIGNALKKRNMIALSDALGRRKGSSKRLTIKDPAKTWLEIQYGWKPMISDIYSALEVLERPYPSVKVTGSAKVPFERSENLPLGRPGKTSYVHKGYFICRKTAYVAVENDLLFSLNQAGVLNPVSLGWEMIPYSFVADWFIPIGDWLRSYSDFVGLQQVAVCESMLGFSEGTQIYGYALPNTGTLNGTRAMMYQRLNSLTGTQLVFHGLRNISLARAASAVALAISAFK